MSTSGFLWKRSRDMSLWAPSEEQIMEEILKFDPRRDNMPYWPFWRDQMLKGRDAFNGLLERHKPLTHFISKGPRQSLTIEKLRWTPTVITKSGKRRGQSVVFLSEAARFNVLEPRTDNLSFQALHLLGIKLYKGESQAWGSSFMVAGNPQFYAGWTEWATFILQKYEGILKSANVYEAVFLSLFEYEKQHHLFRAFCENWSHLTNTCFTRDGEISPSLWDMKRMAGLPIYGIMYDEYNPEEELLFGQNEDGTDRLSPAVQTIYSHYHHLAMTHHMKGKQNNLIVSFRVWLDYFVGMPAEPTKRFATPADPFGENARQGKKTSVLNLQSVGDEAFLTAFLTMWICYFVIPYREAEVIRPEAIVMANMMAQGKTVALAPAALANIYYSLRKISTSASPGKETAILPLHYLNCWLGLHFGGAYTEYALDNKNEHPLMYRFAGGLSYKARPFETRLAFRDPERRGYTFHWKPNCRGYPTNNGRECYDDYAEGRHLLNPAEFDFLISIRSGWLAFRCGSHCFTEEYNPNRIARQFGLDQDIPLSTLDPRLLDRSLRTILHCWEDLFRADTKASFLMPSASHFGKPTMQAATWYSNIKKMKEYWQVDINKILQIPGRAPKPHERWAPAYNKASDPQADPGWGRQKHLTSRENKRGRGIDIHPVSDPKKSKPTNARGDIVHPSFEMDFRNFSGTDYPLASLGFSLHDNEAYEEGELRDMDIPLISPTRPLTCAIPPPDIHSCGDEGRKEIETVDAAIPDIHSEPPIVAEKRKGKVIALDDPQVSPDSAFDVDDLSEDQQFEIALRSSIDTRKQELIAQRKRSLHTTTNIGESSGVPSTLVRSPPNLHEEDDLALSDEDNDDGVEDSGIIGALRGIYPCKEKEPQVVEMVVEEPISEPPGSPIKHMGMAGNVNAEVGSSCPHKETLDSNIQLTSERGKVSLPPQTPNVASMSEGTSSNMAMTPVFQDDALAKEAHDEVPVSSPTTTLPLPGASTPLLADEDVLTSNPPAEQSDFRDASQSHTPTQRLSGSSDGESSRNFSGSYIKTPVLSSASGGSSSSRLLLQLRESMMPAGRKIITDFLASIQAIDVLPTPDVFGEGVNRISEALISLNLPTEAWVNFAKGIEEKLASIHEQESRIANNAFQESATKELEEAKAAYNEASNNYQKAAAEVFARDAQICSLQDEYERIRRKIKAVEDERAHWISQRDTLAHAQELSKQRTSDIELALENLKLEEEKLHTDIATLKKEFHSDIMNNENISFF